MSRTPYKREQGDFELRILRDGRLVIIAPDETLMEVARAFEVQADSEQEHLENQDGEAGDPARQ